MLKATKKCRLLQRHAGVRLPYDRGTFHPPVGDRKANLWWEAMVSDLQAGGMTLVTARRFEIGTVLLVEVQSSSSTVCRTLLVRVTGVKSQMSGGWILPCNFLNPLTAEELQELL